MQAAATTTATSAPSPGQQLPRHPFYNHPPSQSTRAYPDSQPPSAPAVEGHSQHPAREMNPYQYSHPSYGQQQQQQQPPQQQHVPHQQRQSYYQQLPPPPNMGIPQQQSGTMIPPLSSLGSSGHAGYGGMGHGHGQMALPDTSRIPERPAVQMSYSGSTDKYRYTLVVAQQPQRARMCGFGDKDRRPITPPPCIRLDLTDLAGNPVDIDSVDGSFFVLQVDLWSDSADREVNIVRASNSTPTTSISTATTTSFPPTIEPPREPMGFYPGGPPYGFPNMGSHGQYPYASAMHLPPHMGQPAASYMPGGQSSSTMFTRNLIGSLTVNASRLNDPDNNTNYWFVLQDLSVRTEGFFRLKMNFIDVGASGGGGLNRGKAPVLAWVDSDTFQVFSAKKFPGVIESTALSKCFASQGIKIPIRKDTKPDGDDDDEG
nr:velvet complex subunit b [Quercus suber]